MNKFLAVCFAAVTVTAVAAVGSTVYIGKTIEKSMSSDTKATLEKFAPLIAVKSFNYDKSSLGATRTFTLEFGCIDKPLQITWRDQIKHGPFPGFSSVGAATVDSELLLSDATKAEFKATFGLDIPALKARSVVALNGDITTDSTLPTFNGKLPDGTQFKSQAMTSRFIQTGANVSYEVVAPSFELLDSEQGTSMKFTGAKLKGLGTQGKVWWLSTGSSTHEVSKIEMTAKQGDKVSVMVASDVKSISTSKLDGDLMSATSEMKGQFEFDKIKLDNVQIVSGVKRLHVPTLDAMMSAAFSKEGAALLCNGLANAKAKSNEAIQAQFAKQLIEILQDNALKLLPFNPEYSMDKMAATYKGKEGVITYSVGTQGFTADDAKIFKENPRAIIQKLTLAASAKVPVPWVGFAIASKADSDKGLDDAALAQVIEPMVQQGFVVREGDLLLLNAAMKSGEVTLNGKKIPIPQF